MKKLYLIRLLIAGIILLEAFLAIFGMYPVKFLDVELTPLVQRCIVDFSYLAILLFTGVILLTFLFGRFYCSTLCPFGILQEFVSIIYGVICKKPPFSQNIQQKNIPLKYFIAAVVFGTLIGGTTLLIRYIDPYTIFGSFASLSVFGIIATLIVLVLVFYKNRFFCTNICPVGTILGLISKISLNKINIDKEICISCGLCAKNCPSGCIDIKEKTVDNETCIKCLKCLGKCKKNAIKFGRTSQNEVKFNLKRRKLILAGSVLILFGCAIKAGANFTKNFVKKIRDIILPPGAKDVNQMSNKCLNCNLCIKNCPNGILAKADDAAPFVHIDYSKGEGFCKYDCIECSKVCPSGAIAKMKLEDKQRTRIAMAMIDDEKCIKCGICVHSCPAGAIIVVNNKPVIDGTKCIGCGKCKKVCPENAIEIYSINEQRRI